MGVDKDTTVVFSAPLMSTISELASFLAREAGAASASTVANLPSGETRSTPNVQR